MNFEVHYFWVAVALLFITFAPASCQQDDPSIAQAVVFKLTGYQTWKAHP